MLRLASFAAALAVMAGSALAQEKATLQLNWFPSADHTPIYLAKQKGYYAREKIDLTIVRGQGSADSAQKIQLKQAEFGIADTPTVVTAISKGADLRLVGIVFDKGPSNIFFLKSSGIKGPKDLVGKKIAAPPGDSHRLLWPSFAKANGIDPAAIDLVNVQPQGKQAILAGKSVDAVFELYTGRGLMEAAVGAENLGHMLFADHGVATYAHAYFVHTDLLKQKPDLIRGFLKATYEGWRDALENPQAAVDALAAEVQQGVDKKVYMQNFALVADLVATERTRKNGLGWMSKEVMQETIDLTFSGGNMPRKVTPEEAFTNDLLTKITPKS
ncbi:MAG: ABC transporter substrate-binding protein [Alphaproteobacteria bacterium]|nr:ABC transporter substrate-binding protein [Alphaproteobacteria bacterium]